MTTALKIVNIFLYPLFWY